MANEQAQAFIDQATQSLQNSQFQQALDLVDQAIAIEPGVSDSHVLRGICLSQLNQVDAATEAFRKAITLSPYNSKAYYNLAVHENAQGNKKEAIELAREAVGVDPRHTGARKLLTQLEQEAAGVQRTPPGSNPDVLDPHDPLSPPKAAAPGAPPASAPPTPAAPAPPAASKPAPNAPTPPTGSPYAAPTASPYSQSSGGGQFSAQGYQRPGYQVPASALPWVSNMGKAWTAIGVVIALIPLLMLGLLFGTIAAVINGHVNPATVGQSIGVGIDALWVLQILLALLWSVCDILDKRSSWWWLILIVLGSCCCFNWLGLPIYLLAGRKNA